MLRRAALWPLFLTSHLLMVAWISWLLLAKLDFLYPVAYQLLDIEQHIQDFGPQNRYKTGFEDTSPALHTELFNAINRAIHHHGDGLADIHYVNASGQSEPMLRQAEIIHLQDVANLIDHLQTAGLIAALIWCILLVYASRKRLVLPSLRKILIGFALSVAGLVVVIMAAGPTRLFYWLHTLIFPDEHEWFFYYEDSLMTTLMKAPDLFGVIAIFLVMILISLWSGSLAAIFQWLVYNQAKTAPKSMPPPTRASKK